MIISSVLVLVGGALWFHDRLTRPRIPEGGDGEAKSPDDEAQPKADEGECCGMHITCERDSLLASVSPDIVYYDDEELDRFVGRGPGDYSDEEIEEFRDVLLTLLPEDIAGWGRSIQLRGLQLPAPIKEELLMIVAEARREAAVHSAE